MRRLLLALFLVFALAGLALAVAFLLVVSPSRTRLSSATVLKWRLGGELAEQTPGGGFVLPGYEPEPTYADAFLALRQARKDSSLRGLALYIDQPRFGFARAEELRRLLSGVRAAGKFVECYLETAGEGTNGTLSYFLASACSGIHLSPVGEVNLLGLYAPGLFLRSALDKLHIEPQFSAQGAYKSAIETYTRSDYSAPAEEAISAVLDREFEVLVAGIAEARGLSPERVRELVDQAPHSAEDAKRLGLVDGLAYADEFDQLLENKLGEEPRFVSLEDYPSERPAWSPGHIAVLFATGTIVRGKSGMAGLSGEILLGSEDFTALLQRVADDDDIDAVVLRVDSPGGSAIASDLILREVERLAKKKPLVASMGDVAASGGYYIVAKAPTIVAERSTLTGSIGVFSGKLVTGSFQQDLLGITHDPQKRGANADLYSALKPFTPEQAEKFRASTASIYSRFKGHVAAGRRLSPDAVEAVAQGRVWAGADAARRGLVDQLGGLGLAVELAAKAASIDPERAQLDFYPEPPSLLDWLQAHNPWTAIRLPAPFADATTALDAQPGPRLLLPRELSTLARPFE